MEENYTIPLKYRKIENLHIVFWLIKDLCWCVVFKPLAIAMIIPTLIIAAGITWQNRKIATEFYHNIAVFFWIVANCLWMFSEFYNFAEIAVIGTLTGKNLAIFPFSIGIGFLVYYYFVHRIFKRKKK